MKDNEKEIKLLTKRISEIQNKGVKDIHNFTNIFIDNQELAEELLKHYQLVDKNSVVLSREEYQKDFSSQFNKGYKHGSEETAEKIYKEYLCDILSLKTKEEFAKQFGVEINNSNSFNIDEFNKGYAQGIKDLKNSKRC